MRVIGIIHQAEVFPNEYFAGFGMTNGEVRMEGAQWRFYVILITEWDVIVEEFPSDHGFRLGAKHAGWAFDQE